MLEKNYRQNLQVVLYCPVKKNNTLIEPFVVVFFLQQSPVYKYLLPTSCPSLIERVKRMVVIVMVVEENLVIPCILFMLFFF